ncbi:hypothetical protein BDY19DRAFT_944233 [Irpex rosettiformis]|uniref:Uncharacterized protein n=1 Tax=Irpex rosettiformis TaxID=378272 RepID=A0ACB8U4K0_9APHY|nr:hypothetical protein BDY19DRAFT_944233 [Irpex rosettiformis]
MCKFRRVRNVYRCGHAINEVSYPLPIRIQHSPSLLQPDVEVGHSLACSTHPHDTLADQM